MFKTLKIGLVSASFIAASTASAGYWMNGNKLTTCGAKAYEMLKGAEYEGLDAKDYAFAVHAVEKAVHGGGSAGHAESKLENAMRKYVDDVRNGRFNPKLADKQLVMKPEPVNASAVVAKGVKSGSCHWMDEQAPPYAEYRQLRVLMNKYQMMKAKHTNWSTIPTNIKLFPGDSSENIAIVRHNLAVLGDISHSYDNSSTYYDDDLKDAVKAFQGRHGLKKDGQIGPLTAREINRTPEDRIKQIKVTMERWRWMPRNPGNRHIKVNIAGFELEAVENGHVRLRSPIIVGTDYRETPVFTAHMSGVKFNPSWSVPHNLAVKDKLPELKKNAANIVRNNFVVYRYSGGKMKEVNPTSINWSQYSASNFPFRLRQRPGNNNALGKIRFTINSPFAIFLHSTPHKHLFNYSNRSFSSGCIRVRDVTELANFALDKSEWTNARIDNEMKGHTTKYVTMDRKIPVHITYFTVWIDESGVPHFMQDIYGQDKQVWNVMQRH